MLEVISDSEPEDERSFGPLDNPGAGADDQRVAAWAKANPIAGQDPSVFRLDDFGRWMRFSDYGDRTSHFGWEIQGSGDLADLEGQDMCAICWLSAFFSKAATSPHPDPQRRQSVPVVSKEPTARDSPAWMTWFGGVLAGR